MVAQQTPRRTQNCITSSPKLSGSVIMGAIQVLIVMNLLSASSNWLSTGNNNKALNGVLAVNVQKLIVPDLVVIDQLNLQQRQQESRSTEQIHLKTQNINNQPEAASLINISQDLNSNDQQPQITFECLISFDKKKDKNLIVKWHHDDRIEPIYQWIPELNKRSIAPQYRAYIAPIVAHQQTADFSGPQAAQAGNNNQTLGTNTNQIQLLEAGFRLIRPSKELGGKYTCSAISTQNDDSKWKKMIVYTPPRAFRFNASRTDIGVQLANQRDRLIHLTQPTIPSSTNQLPLVYRMRGFDNSQPVHATTISSQVYSTIDYVNVYQQRTRQQSTPSPWLIGLPPPPTSHLQSGLTNSVLNVNSFQQQAARQNKQHQAHNGVKLICDIDQVFPVPEVSIYRLGKMDGSHPDKLAKLDTRIERNSVTGLYHVQVISLLEDDELQMKYGLNEPVYFECLIALTNLELSKYADNKRSIVYRPGAISNSLQGTSEDMSYDQTVGNGALRYSNALNQQLIFFMLLMSCSIGYYRLRT